MLTRILLLFFLLSGQNLWAQTQNQAEIAQVKKNIQKIMPGLPISSLKTTPVKNLYELMVGDSIVYITGDAKYYLAGKLFDVVNQVNLTDAASNQLRKKQLKKVSKDEMIIFPAKGEHKYTMSVFTDTSCPFCSRLHKEVPELNENGVEVRYMLYPRAGVGSHAYQTMVNVWCSKDRQKALTKAKETGELENKNCDTPIGKHMALAREMGLSGTPMIVLENGALINGYKPAKAIIRQLKSIKK